MYSSDESRPAPETRLFGRRDTQIKSLVEKMGVRTNNQGAHSSWWRIV